MEIRQNARQIWRASDSLKMLINVLQLGKSCFIALLFFVHAVYWAIIFFPAPTPVSIHWTRSFSHGRRSLSRLRAALSVSDCCVIAWRYNFYPHAASFICPVGLITIAAVWLMRSFRGFHSLPKRSPLALHLSGPKATRHQLRAELCDSARPYSMPPIIWASIWLLNTF